MFDAERYGGRRAYLKHIKERGKTLMGAYSALSDIDWTSARRLVFVCKGNICRSPYAEARARALGLDAISVGLEASDGASANQDAMLNARSRQIDMSSHLSRKLRTSGIQSNDLVLFFESQHLTTFRNLGVESSQQVSLLGLWGNPVRPHISDPYGKSDLYFQECFSVIDDCVGSIAHRMADR